MKIEDNHLETIKKCSEIISTKEQEIPSTTIRSDGASYEIKLYEKRIKFNFLLKFLKIIEENGSEVQRCCQYTFEKFFPKIIEQCEFIINSKIEEDIKITSTKPFLYVFYELYLIKKVDKDFYMVEEAWKNASAIFYNYRGVFSSAEPIVNKIMNELPFLILKRDPISEDQKKFHSILNETESRLIKKENLLTKNLDEIENKIETIEAYDKKIKGILDNYNFAGLHNGFAKMYEEKLAEKTNNLLSMAVLGAVAIFLAVILAYTSYSLTLTEAAIELKLMTLIPILGIEILVVYFFRLTHVEYRSINSQTLQIKLRMTLCQFIQSYASYSKEIGEQSLEKFENIIFSGIVSDPQNIPSTYDGLDQIGQLISKIKN